jgi:hypothetical protein
MPKSGKDVKILSYKFNLNSLFDVFVKSANIWKQKRHWMFSLISDLAVFAAYLEVFLASVVSI